MNTHVLANVKAYIALVGAIAAGLLGVYAADSVVGQVCTVIVVVATAFATWRVPNTPKAKATRASARHAGAYEGD